jgi:hypothetical protein
MTFAVPLGLLALAAIPAIVAIHLLRRRFPVRPVAGLFLWKAAHDVPDGGRRVDRLPITASLLLECLAALMLAFIIAGATLDSSSGAEHLVVLLDDSVSMTAMNAAGESPRDRAARYVASEVARLGPRGRITIVRSGERPAVIAGPAAFSLEAERALTDWRPLARGHSLADGLRLARELSGPSGSVLILSDRRPEESTERLAPREQWAALGISLPNVGIVDAHRGARLEDGGGTLTLTVRNNSDAPASRTLRLTAGEVEVAVRKLEVPAGVSSVTVDLPPNLPPVKASLSDDALAADNAVVLVEPRPQIVGVSNRLKTERGRDALDRALDAVAGVARTDAAHLAFVESAETASTPGMWRVRFGVSPGRSTAGGDAVDLIGPFVLEKRHPLLHGVTFSGVAWTGAAPLAPVDLHPLASAGDRVLIGTVASNAADPAFIVNLDLARTNLIRSPDWPILISNLIEMRRRELPGPEQWNYRVGEFVRVRFERQPEGPVRLRIGATERTLPQTRLVEFIAPSPGGLAEILDGDAVRFQIGINPLEESEGDLRVAATDTLGELDPPTSVRDVESGAAFDPLFWTLLTLAGAAMLANWFLMAPRRARA